MIYPERNDPDTVEGYERSNLEAMQGPDYLFSALEPEWLRWAYDDQQEVTCPICKWRDIRAKAIQEVEQGVAVVEGACDPIRLTIKCPTCFKQLETIDL